MMKGNATRPSLAVGLILLMWLGATPSAGGEPSRVVVFGDSLSDPSNAFLLLREVERPPFELIPDAPYATLHFSNGITWVERLARALDVPLSAGPALLAPKLFSNYAVGAARARPVGEFDLATQVSRYLDDFHGRAPSRALYIVFIGGNDLRDALEVAPDFPTSFSILLGAVATIEESIRRLAAEGAQTFLVANAPDLSLVPAVRLQGPLAQEAAKALSEFFNGNLELMLQTLQADPDLALLTLKRLDVFAFLTAVVQHPESFGLDDAVNPCITPGVLPNAICSHPDRFLFWDGIHPTRTGHRLLAVEAEAALAEP